MKMLKIAPSLISLFVLVLVVGCSSSGGDSGTTTPTTPTTADGTGVWEGTFTENGVGTFDLIGLIEGNQLRFISLDAGAIYVGTVAVSGSNFTSTATGFQIGGTVFATTNMTGTIATKSTISGTFSTSYGTTGSFSLTYDPVTDKGSSLALAAGTWTDLASNTATITVNSAGVVTGSDIAGCVYTGTVSITDPAVNIYDLSLGVTSCGVFDGGYAGYFVISDDVSPNDTLTFVVNNSNFVVVNVLTRT
jgi:hypothetical protein